MQNINYQRKNARGSSPCQGTSQVTDDWVRRIKPIGQTPMEMLVPISEIERISQNNIKSI
jgi:hypothetical protein